MEGDSLNLSNQQIQDLSTIYEFLETQASLLKVLDLSNNLLT